MKRTYIKRRIWHLGSRKKQKGGFLPILGALARPLLVSPADAAGGEVPRNNILLRRLPAPKRLQLPNGCVFFAKYQRVNRHAPAPFQVRIARTYVQKIGSRQQRIGRTGPKNRRR